MLNAALVANAAKEVPAARPRRLIVDSCAKGARPVTLRTVEASPPEEVEPSTQKKVSI